MIKVDKHSTVPKSLSTGEKYSGTDVVEQLHKDQHCKCYLCERRLCTDFQVEHLRSRNHYPELSFKWCNLFLVCNYCNNKKSDCFDEIMNPAEVDVEEVIRQSVDFGQRKCIFTGNDDSMVETVELLNRIHNGTGKLRTIREEKFFEYVLGLVNEFQRVVKQYLENQSHGNAELVREQLTINQECLGFKYWIIKSNPLLESIFADDIVWNK